MIEDGSIVVISNDEGHIQTPNIWDSGVAIDCASVLNPDSVVARVGILRDLILEAQVGGWGVCEGLRQGKSRVTHAVHGLLYGASTDVGSKSNTRNDNGWIRRDTLSLYLDLECDTREYLANCSLSGPEAELITHGAALHKVDRTLLLLHGLADQ